MSFNATKQVQPTMYLKAKGGTAFAEWTALTFENGLVVPAVAGTTQVFLVSKVTKTTPAAGERIACMPVFGQPIFERVPLKKTSGTVTQAVVGKKLNLKDGVSVDFNTQDKNLFLVLDVDVDNNTVDGIFVNEWA